MNFFQNLGIFQISLLSSIGIGLTFVAFDYIDSRKKHLPYALPKAIGICMFITAIVLVPIALGIILTNNVAIEEAYGNPESVTETKEIYKHKDITPENDYISLTLSYILEDNKGLESLTHRFYEIEDITYNQLFDDFNNSSTNPYRQKLTATKNKAEYSIPVRIKKEDLINKSDNPNAKISKIEKYEATYSYLGWTKKMTEKVTHLKIYFEDDKDNSDQKELENLLN